LLDQHAPIDVFGVGTNLVTGAPDAALDGVYKLAYADGKPRIKLSENIKKITLPGRKQVYRILHEDNTFFGADVITLSDEKDPQRMYHPSEPDKSLLLEGYKQEPLLQKVMENGKMVGKNPPLKEIAAYCQSRLKMLPEEHKRFQYPHIYKVGISDQLLRERDELKRHYKK
jgi:nicotinate phosphoribosyltransferase